MFFQIHRKHSIKSLCKRRLVYAKHFFLMSNRKSSKDMSFQFTKLVSHRIYKVNSEDYNNNERDKLFLRSPCKRWDWVEDQRLVFPNASHLTSPLFPPLKTCHSHRFASSTNCLFMHSAERRFCCCSKLEGDGGLSHDKCCPLKLHQFTSWNEVKILCLACEVNLIENCRGFRSIFKLFLPSSVISV